MILCFLQTVPLVNVLPVVVGVVSTGVIIVIAVVIIVCLLIVAKCKHRKNSLGKDYTAATASYCLWFTVVVFFTAPIKHVYCKQPTIESRFVLSHMHVQICQLTSFHFASQFFYRYVEKKDLKVKLKHSTVYCIT